MIGPNKEYGEKIMDAVERHQVRFFKAYQLREKTGLTFGQFNMGVRWLAKEGIIEKTGGRYSNWRVLG